MSGDKVGKSTLLRSPNSKAENWTILVEVAFRAFKMRSVLILSP